MIKIQRTIPPSASPVSLKNLLYGLSGMFFEKRFLKRLEDEIKECFGVRHVFFVSSGKAALTLILNALKTLNQRQEALIPAYTCFSVPSAIVKAGLKVSLCDIDSQTFDFDYKLLEKAINKNTLCVIPNHLFGIPADMDKINSICKDKDIFVIEDAAQAMGGSYKGSKLGTIGDVGFFSLGRGKNITCGSGGIIVTNSDTIAHAIEKEYAQFDKPSAMEQIINFCKAILMRLFIHPSLYWFPSGLPFLKLGETIFHKDFPIKKLSGMEAGLLNDWQRRLEESNQIRKENAKLFYTFIAPSPLGGEGRGEGAIPYLRLPVLVNNKETRDKIFCLLQENGLGVSSMYPSPINEIAEIKHQFDGNMFPNSTRVSETLLTIPTHQFLSKKDKKEIYNLFHETYSNQPITNNGQISVISNGKEAKSLQTNG